MRRETFPVYIAGVLSVLGVLGLLPNWGLALRQAFYHLLGVALFLYVVRFNIRAVVMNSRVAYYVTLILLVAVLFVGGGAGVRRWFNLGFMNFQPSELAKVVVPVYLIGVEGTLRRLMLGVIPWALILVEPDLATSSVVLILTLYVIFITARDLKVVVLLFSVLVAPLVSFAKALFWGFMASITAALVVLRASLSWVVVTLGLVISIGLITPVLWERGLKEYQRKRILAMINPQENREVLYQSYQSRIALANAGPFGKGIKGATQKNYGFLPASHTDFAFTSIVEVYGYIAGFVLLVLLFLLPLSLFYVSLSPDPYVRMVVSTAGIFFLYQTSVNLMSVLGLLPIAGIPLPFITYGGSHLLSEWLWLALAYSAYRWRVET